MKTKNLVLGIGIVIVFMFLLHNGIHAFYSNPEYEQYCNSSLFRMSYPEKMPYTYGTNCTYSKELRDAEQTCYDNKGQPIYEYDDNGCQTRVKECNYCQTEYDNAREKYQKNVFIIAIILGIITLIVGYARLSIEPVGSALMASGIGAIMYGTIQNWNNLDNLGRFILLFIAFVILIWIAVKLNTEKEKKGFWQKLGLRRKK
jgi:hypothetical protein